MIELALAIGAVVMMAKVASNDNESAVLWGVVTAALAALFLFTVQLPFLRVLFAIIASFVLMTVFKTIRDK